MNNSVTRWLLTISSALIVGALSRGVRLEQSSWNPYTDSCDYIKRTDDSPEQVVCTFVWRVR